MFDLPINKIALEENNKSLLVNMQKSIWLIKFLIFSVKHFLIKLCNTSWNVSYTHKPRFYTIIIMFCAYNRNELMANFILLNIYERGLEESTKNENYVSLGAFCLDVDVCMSVLNSCLQLQLLPRSFKCENYEMKSDFKEVNFYELISGFYEWKQKFHFHNGIF